MKSIWRAIYGDVEDFLSNGDAQLRKSWPTIPLNPLSKLSPSHTPPPFGNLWIREWR